MKITGRYIKHELLGPFTIGRVLGVWWLHIPMFVATLGGLSPGFWRRRFLRR